MTRIDYYCPACGDIQRGQPAPIISPGDHPWTCPSCKKRWRVNVQFYSRRPEGKRICAVCGHEEKPHPYTHPFEPIKGNATAYGDE